MNADVIWPTHLAIYNRLTADPALNDDITGVYDHVPEGTAFPYITIGDVTVTPAGAHDRFGARSTVTLHAWSTFLGRQEITTLVGHLMRLFDHQPLSIDGHATVVVAHEQTVTLRETDPDIRHAAVRFSLTTELQAA